MGKIHAPPEQFAREARVTAGQYKLAFKRSREQPERFWGDVGRRLDHGLSRIRQRAPAELAG